MARTLEEYTAEVARSYEPARQAIQNQINAIDGRTNSALNSINRQYQTDQQTLNRNRDSAIHAASLAAAGNGGSFGGSGNIARRKYYDQTFVPAQTQLQTNNENRIAEVRNNAQQHRLSLEAQLANLQSEASKYGMQRYDAAQEAARQERLARAQIAAQNAANYLMSQKTNPNNQKLNKKNISFDQWLNSSDALDVDGWAEDFTTADKIQYLKKLQDQYRANPQNYHILNGSTYQDYLKWRKS